MGLGRFFVFCMLVAQGLLIDAAAAHSRAMLVIIDMQAYFAERGGNHKDPTNQAKLAEIEKRQVEVIEEAVRREVPVVVVEYKKYGPTNVALRKAIGDYPKVIRLMKDKDGLFDDPRAADHLKNFAKLYDRDSLLIMGANSYACVKCTINGAIKNGFQVVSYKKGVADFNSKQFVYPTRYGAQFWEAQKGKRYAFIQVNTPESLFSEFPKIQELGIRKGANIKEGCVKLLTKLNARHSVKVIQLKTKRKTK